MVEMTLQPLLMLYTPQKPTWHWRISAFNRKYILKWWIFYCHVSFWGSTSRTNVSQQQLPLKCSHFLLPNALKGPSNYTPYMTCVVCSTPQKKENFSPRTRCTCQWLRPLRWTLESSLDEKLTSESWGVMLPVAAAAKERLPWMWVLGCPWQLVTR